MEWGKRRMTQQVSDQSEFGTGLNGISYCQQDVDVGILEVEVRVVWGNTVGTKPYHLGPYPYFGEVGIRTVAALLSSCIFTTSEPA